VPVHYEFSTSLDRILIDQRLLASALSTLIRFLRDNPAEEKGMIDVQVSTPEDRSLLIVIEGFRTLSLGVDVRNAFIPLYPYMKTATQFGPGPGPASAYGFIKAHGGTLDAETTPYGTRFRITLPLERIQGDEI
jgi:hypothetical protein